MDATNAPSNGRKPLLLIGSLVQITGLMTTQGIDYIEIELSSDPLDPPVLPSMQDLLRDGQSKYGGVIWNIDKWFLLRFFKPMTLLDKVVFIDRRLVKTINELMVLTSRYPHIVLVPSTYVAYEFEDIFRPLFGDLLFRMPRSLFTVRKLVAEVRKGPSKRTKGVRKPEVKTYLTRFVDTLKGSGLQIVLYDTDREVAIATQAFLEEVYQNLILRIYIPKERIWAGELDKLLNLFAEYLQRVGGFSVRLDENRTENGVVYSFSSKSPSINPEQLTGQLEEFATFLELCLDDPSRALEFINQGQISKEQLTWIVSKYAKEARRLSLDIQHEREAKLLSIRQRLQSELLDVSMNPDGHTLDELIKNTQVPSRLDDILRMATQAGTVNPLIQYQNQVVNINPQIIEKVEGIVAQEINGNIVYGAEDRQLLDMIAQHTKGLEASELKSALDELKDEAVPQSHRITAWRRLRTFVDQHSGTAREIAVPVLQEYLKQLLMGS